MNNDIKKSILKGIFTVIIAPDSVEGVVLIINISLNFNVTVEEPISIEGALSITSPYIKSYIPEIEFNSVENNGTLTDSIPFFSNLN